MSAAPLRGRAASARGELASLRDRKLSAPGRIASINSWLLAAVFACIPVQVAPAYVLTAVILVLWLVEGRFAEKFRHLASEPLVRIFVGYYAVLLASMMWTADLEWGWRMMRRQNFFLLFPLYLSVARPEHLGRYVAAFLISISACELLAFYNWLQLHQWPWLPEGLRVDKDPADIAPFVDRMMYTPALALAGYLAGHRLLFDSATGRQRVLYGALLLATTLNLLLAGGRAGMVGFIVLLVLLVAQRYARRPALAALVASTLAGAILVGGYHGSDYFKARVDDAVNEIVHFEERANTSVGLRMVYALNAARMFAANPLLGVGIGDYPEEYARINEAHTPEWGMNWNPHNQYLFALTAAGLLGGAMLVLVLLVPLLRRSPDDGYQRIRRAVPLLLIVICLAESYLLRSNISMMYSLFTAALWRGVSDGAGSKRAQAGPGASVGRTRGVARQSGPATGQAG